MAMEVLYDGNVNKDALVALSISLYESSWQCLDGNDTISLT